MSITSPVTESEPEWGARFSRGDRDAFIHFYDQYAPPLRAFLHARCRGGISADDVAHDVWLRVWQARETFDGRHFRAWLYQIARNHVFSEYRKRRPARLPEQFAAAAVVAESREVELAALRDCLQHIGGDFVEALHAQFAGDTTEQIATRLAISSSTVYNRLSRAKNQLRDCMKAKLA